MRVFAPLLLVAAAAVLSRGRARTHKAANGRRGHEDFFAVIARQGTQELPRNRSCRFNVPEDMAGLRLLLVGDSTLENKVAAIVKPCKTNPRTADERFRGGTHCYTDDALTTICFYNTWGGLPVGDRLARQVLNDVPRRSLCTVTRYQGFHVVAFNTGLHFLHLLPARKGNLPAIHGFAANVLDFMAAVDTMQRTCHGNRTEYERLRTTGGDVAAWERSFLLGLQHATQSFYATKQRLGHEPPPPPRPAEAYKDRPIFIFRTCNWVCESRYQDAYQSAARFWMSADQDKAKHSAHCGPHCSEALASDLSKFHLTSKGTDALNALQLSSLPPDIDVWDLHGLTRGRCDATGARDGRHYGSLQPEMLARLWETVRKARRKREPARGGSERQ